MLLKRGLRRGEYSKEGAFGVWNRRVSPTVASPAVPFVATLAEAWGKEKQQGMEKQGGQSLKRKH